MHSLDIPSDDVVRAASDAVRALLGTVHSNRPSRVEFVAEEAASARVAVPAEAVDLILEVLWHLSNGHAVTITPVEAELTTQLATEILNVSRPFVITLLDGGQIPFRKVGTHRRVRLDDVLAYKRLDDARRRDAADALAAEAQALGLDH